MRKVETGVRAIGEEFRHRLKKNLEECRIRQRWLAVGLGAVMGQTLKNATHSRPDFYPICAR